MIRSIILSECTFTKMLGACSFNRQVNLARICVVSFSLSALSRSEPRNFSQIIWASVSQSSLHGRLERPGINYRGMGSLSEKKKLELYKKIRLYKKYLLS